MQQVYSLSALMAQTRVLAASYRLQTGQTLPIGHELAKYDVEQRFGFIRPEKPMAQVDLIGHGPWANKKNSGEIARAF